MQGIYWYNGKESGGEMETFGVKAPTARPDGLYRTYLFKAVNSSMQQTIPHSLGRDQKIPKTWKQIPERIEGWPLLNAAAQSAFSSSWLVEL